MVFRKSADLRTSKFRLHQKPIFPAPHLALQNQPTHRWRLKASDACILSATPLMLEDWMRKRRNQKSS